MSSTELRRASETLRLLAEKCGPFEGEDCTSKWADEYDPAVHEEEHGYFSNDLAFIVTMDPGVGLLLADLLDRTADEWEVEGGCASGYGEALRLAARISG